MNFRAVLDFINQLPEKSIVVARELYLEKFTALSFQTFLKYLERLAQKNMLMAIGKGLYCRPVITPFGIMSVNDVELRNYFVNENETGVEIGYGLYNKYKLTTQISKNIKIYSNKAIYNVQKIGNLQVKKCLYTPNLQFAIECMEILENYNSIEDLNKEYFYRFCEEIGCKYDEESFLKVFSLGFYKKRTLAFLNYILDCFKIENTLSRYLNASSKYKYPKLEDLKVA